MMEALTGAARPAGRQDQMPRLLFTYFSKRMAISALLIEVCLVVPVVMTSIFHYLPPTAVMLEFIRMAGEGMISVLYSLRLSVWAIVAPAAAVGAGAVVLGYATSCFIAPSYVGDMHDVIYVIRNSLNHRMLEPAHFYTFDDGKRTLYFQRWQTPDIAANIFINQLDPEKKEEQIIAAARAEFRRNETGVVMIMGNGSIQTRSQDSANIRAANFDEYVMPLAMQGSGGLPKRTWRGVFELPGSAFFADRRIEAADPHKLAEWTSEAAKRTGIPILALTHVLFGVALVLTVSNATGRQSNATTLTVLAVPVIHIAMLIAMETLVRKNPNLVVLVAAAIVVEFGAALWLLQRQNRIRKPSPAGEAMLAEPLPAT